MPATDQPEWASIPDRPWIILTTEEGEWSISASPTDPDEFRLRFGARKPPYDIAFTEEVGRFAGVNEAKVMAETWEAVAAAVREGRDHGIEETVHQSEAAGFQTYIPEMDRQEIGPHILYLVARDDVTRLDKAVDDGVDTIGIMFSEEGHPRPAIGDNLFTTDVDTAGMVSILEIRRSRPVKELMTPISDEEFEAWRASRQPAPAVAPGR